MLVYNESKKQYKTKQDGITFNINNFQRKSF